MLPVVEPAATVSDVGTDSAALLPDSVTTAPPVATACDSVTVHVVLPPEEIEVGEHCSAVTFDNGATVTDAVAEPLFSDAVTVTAAEAVTVPAVAVKVPVVAPAATVTDAGTVSAALFPDSATAVPPVGAACDSVTVHVVLPPEETELGEHCKPVTVTIGTTVTDAAAEPFIVAVTVTAVEDVTVPALAAKVPVVAPAASVIDAGTVNAALFPDSATAVPPVAAACDSVTVHVVLPPEEIEVGEHCSAVTFTDGATVSDAVAEPPFNDPVTVTAVDEVTVPAVAAKVPVVAPAATVTDAGTVSAALFPDSVTAAALAVTCDNVTVHVVLPPEEIELGEHCSAVTVVNGTTVTVAVAEPPFNDPVTVTAAEEVTVPAVAMKVPVVAPAATVTDAGTVSAALFPDSVTALALAAACDNVTVHVVLPPEEIELGEHRSAVTVVNGTTVTVAVAEPPFNDPVTVAAAEEVTVPAVAVKVPVVAPAATVTDAGTVSAALFPDSVTAAPLAAACDSVTVHVVLPLEEIELGEHCSAVTVGDTLMVPPVPATPAKVPSGIVPIVLLIAIGATALPPVAGSVAVTTATTPLPIAALFIPVARHVSDPTPGTQERLSPAAVNDEPAAALSDVMAPGV